MTTVRRFGIALAMIVAIAAMPFVLALGAGSVAAALGCQLDESNVNPCVVFGLDLGPALYATALIGLLMLIGVPVAGVAFLIWLVLAGVAWAVRRRQLKD
jgi:hypothetical protein